ncbi:MAG: pilin [bacterium]|nr:pilin [bacterium]
MKKYIFTIILFLTQPSVVFGETSYKLAAPIPGGGSEIPIDGGFIQYVEFLFPFMLSVAAIAALVMFVYGGIEYMTAGGSDRVSRAKGTITSALAGLMIAVFSVLILETINPELIKLELAIPQIAPVSIGTAPPGGGSTIPSGGCTNDIDCTNPLFPKCVEINTNVFACRGSLAVFGGLPCDPSTQVCRSGFTCKPCVLKLGLRCCDGDADQTGCQTANDIRCYKN